jgi:predicted amidohydrolase YtcJ
MDVVLRGARIWTGDPARPWAESLLSRDGRIVVVGADHDVATHLTGRETVVDVDGPLVVPGFVDAHNHIRLGSGSGAVQLHGATTLAEIRARIGSWLGENPDAPWVYGEGFGYDAFPEGRYPHADDLAGACGGRPAMLLDYSVHAALFNHEALSALGVTASTTHVPYGWFEHDDDGALTGYLHDYATKGLSRAGLAALKELVPVFSDDEQYARVRAGLDMAAAYGITTVVEPQNSLDDLALFARARDEGAMRSRVVAALFHPPGTTADDLAEFERAIAAEQGDLFRLGPLKLYIDDIVEPHTAAMLAPYANRPDTSGSAYYEPSEFDELIARLDARGLQCFVHATGDRGNRLVLDAFEHARRVNGVRDSRHQVVHVECLDAADVPRFGDLGVVACMQPRHCAPEIVREWRANVGEQRWRHAWPMRGLHESGAVLAFSSDWNVAEMDPMVGLYTAATRADLDGRESWVPEETIEVETALAAYTAGSAWANFCDGERGVLAPGALADLVVLSQDVLAIEPAAILETRALLTMVDGDVVHQTGR